MQKTLCPVQSALAKEAQKLESYIKKWYFHNCTSIEEAILADVKNLIIELDADKPTNGHGGFEKGQTVIYQNTGYSTNPAVITELLPFGYVRLTSSASSIVRPSSKLRAA